VGFDHKPNIGDYLYFSLSSISEFVYVLNPLCDWLSRSIKPLVKFDKKSLFFVARMEKGRDLSVFHPKKSVFVDSHVRSVYGLVSNFEFTNQSNFCEFSFC